MRGELEEVSVHLCVNTHYVCCPSRWAANYDQQHVCTGPQMGRALNTLYFHNWKFPRFACCMALWASCQYKREQWSSILFKSFSYNNGLLECSSGDVPCIAQLKTRHIECTKERAIWYSRRLVDRHTCSDTLLLMFCTTESSKPSTAVFYFLMWWPVKI